MELLGALLEQRLDAARDELALCEQSRRVKLRRDEQEGWMK